MLRGEHDSPDIACIDQLICALEEQIPNPVRDLDGPFLMPIEAVHTIPGRGTQAIRKWLPTAILFRYH
jgi:elongation factor Tu